MLQVHISSVTITKSLAIDFHRGDMSASSAVLLGPSGERLKTFKLGEQHNVLSLDEFQPGIYALRVEAGQEVVVQQIVIP